MKDILPNIPQMLDQLGLEGGGPRAYTSAEAVEGVVELNCRLTATIQYSRHCLPQDLHQTN